VGYAVVILIILLVGLLAAPAVAGDYTVSLDKIPTASCSAEFAPAAEAVDGVDLPLDPADVVLSCTNPTITSSDLQGGLFTVEAGVVTEAVFDLAFEASLTPIIDPPPPSGDDLIAQQTADMAPGTWRELTLGRTFDAVRTTMAELQALGGLLNDPYVQPNIIRDSKSVLTSWNSMTRGNGGDWYAWGGGHNNYGGNEVYHLDLETLAWDRIAPPHALEIELFNPNHVWLPRDTPGAIETYDLTAFLPNCGTEGCLLIPSSWGVFPRYHPPGIGKYWLFDVAARQWIAREGHEYRRGSLEGTPDGGAIGLDGYNISMYHTILYDDQGNETYCDNVLYAETGTRALMLFSDPDTGMIYAAARHGVFRVNLAGCNTTLTPLTGAPTGPDTFYHVGAAVADGVAYFWWGTRTVVEFDISTYGYTYNTPSSGPNAVLGKDGLDRILGKWTYWPPAGVFIGIHDHTGVLAYKP
jgi:hypothetical protein